MPPPDDPEGREPADPLDPEDPEDPEEARPTGPLESLYQELVRRAAVLGLSGFALTEEALRKAVSEAVPRDWMEFWARQGTDARRDLLEALVREFGDWLRGLDPEAFQRDVLHTLLEDFDISLEVKISAHPRERPEGGRSLELVRRRR